MAEESNPNATENPEQAAPPGEADHDRPIGAFVFVLLMLASYIIYWFATWFQVIIERGGV